jgi:hypothetical protein
MIYDLPTDQGVLRKMRLKMPNVENSTLLLSLRHLDECHGKI